MESRLENLRNADLKQIARDFNLPNRTSPKNKSQLVKFLLNAVQNKQITQSQLRKEINKYAPKKATPTKRKKATPTKRKDLQLALEARSLANLKKVASFFGISVKQRKAQLIRDLLKVPDMDAIQLEVDQYPILKSYLGKVSLEAAVSKSFSDLESKQARYQIKGKDILQTLPEIFETHFDYEYQRMADAYKHDFEKGIYEEMPSPASIAESALYYINLDRSIALPSCNDAIKEKGYTDLRIKLNSLENIPGKTNDKILSREGKNYYAQAYYASFEPSLPFPSDATYEEIRTMVLDKARDSGKNLLDDLQQIEDALTIRAYFALDGFVTAPVDVYICLYGFLRNGGIIINIFAIYPMYSSLRYDEETIFGYENAVKFVQEFSIALNRAKLLFWGNNVDLSPDNLPIITERVVFVDNFSDYPYIESGYERPWKLPHGEGVTENPLFNLYYLSNVFKGKLYGNGGSVQDFKLTDFMTPEEIEEANRLYRN